MEALFIEPASLPGGKEWQEACAEAEDDFIREVLHCDISPAAGFVQVLLLLAVYGGILFKASQLIASGSELLLVVPSLRSIVGSVVLPILGAVPDGAIVLFSGLGPNAQETLAVGVGALAGSISMLLTIPWFLSVIAGRVSIKHGRTTYRTPKLDPPGSMSWRSTGVEPHHIVKTNGQIMLITAIPFFVIQGAAFLTGSYFKAEQTAEGTAQAASFERGPAMICFIVCLGFFFWYLWHSMHPSKEEEDFNNQKVRDLQHRYIKDGQLSLAGLFYEQIEAARKASESSPLIDENDMQNLEKIIFQEFHKYDKDGSGAIDRTELKSLMIDLGETGPCDVDAVLSEMDSDNNGEIEFREFLAGILHYISLQGSGQGKTETTAQHDLERPRNESSPALHEEEEEEEEEVPHDLKHLPPGEQIKAVKKRAFYMMTAGTALVLIFSDPMVSVMSDVGRRVGIPAFYISFLLAPLASNASELLAAFQYAKRKTRKSVTISFSTLLGATIMNNSFVLSIFMLLIVLKGLAWQFTAETISILVVELYMFNMSSKRIQTVADGFGVLAMFPLSLGIVAFLENVVGLD